jgi:two-component sensor histidine kinase
MLERIVALPLRIIDYYTGPGDRKSIEYWQRFIFYVISLAGMVLGTFALVATEIELLRTGRPLAGAILAVLYGVNVSVILVRRLPVGAKTLVIALAFYLFGLASLILAGPEGESGIWFSVSVLLCSLFIGLRASALFACLDLLTGLAFGVLHAKGLVGWPILKDFPFASWLVQSANIFFVDMMFAIANTILIRGVGDTFRNLNAAEGKILASLAEKETLIRELYHRTRNNMQVVSSLLMLRSSGMEDGTPKADFKDVLDKIAAMSLAHQKLYESRDLSKIDVAEYIRDLVALMMSSHGVPPGKVQVDLDLEAMTMLVDTAVPCGLIISEIVANALEHAFPGDRAGRISIGLKGSAGDLVELRIADDGVGLPEGFRIESGGKMGMRTLRNIATHQLQGSLRLDAAGGVAYTIRFKRNLYDERVTSVG